MDNHLEAQWYKKQKNHRKLNIECFFSTLLDSKQRTNIFYGVGRGLVVTSLLIVPFNYELIFFLQTHTKSKNWSEFLKRYIKHETTFLTCRTLFRKPSWLPWEWRRQRREQRWWRGMAWLTSSGSCRRGIPTRETRGSWRHPTVICC